MEIDIRSLRKEEIDVIRLRDPSSDEYSADCIRNENDLIIVEDSDSKRSLLIEDEQHALDLIEALKKAIELGWFE